METWQHCLKTPITTLTPAFTNHSKIEQKNPELSNSNYSALKCHAPLPELQHFALQHDNIMNPVKCSPCYTTTCDVTFKYSALWPISARVCFKSLSEWRANIFNIWSSQQRHSVLPVRQYVRFHEQQHNFVNKCDIQETFNIQWRHCNIWVQSHGRLNSREDKIQSVQPHADSLRTCILWHTSLGVWHKLYPFAPTTSSDTS